MQAAFGCCLAYIYIQFTFLISEYSCDCDLDQILITNSGLRFICSINIFDNFVLVSDQVNFRR